MNHATSRSLKLTSYGSHHIGSRKSVDQDRVFAYPEKQFTELVERFGYLYVIADGVSTGQHSELAADLICRDLPLLYYNTMRSLGTDLPAYLNVRPVLSGAIQEVNRRVWELGQQPETYRSSSTFVCLLLLGRFALIAHAGDSRAYLAHTPPDSRLPSIQKLTIDHSWVEEFGMALVEQGRLTLDDLSRDKRRHYITRLLGRDEDLGAVDFSLINPASQYRLDTLEVTDGDRLLLCTDGLWDMAEQQERGLLEEWLGEALQKPSLERATHYLFDLANRAGGKDNIGVVLVKVESVEDEAMPPASLPDQTLKPTNSQPFQTETGEDEEALADENSGWQTEELTENFTQSREHGPQDEIEEHLDQFDLFAPTAQLILPTTDPKLSDPAFPLVNSPHTPTTPNIAAMPAETEQAYIQPTAPAGSNLQNRVTLPAPPPSSNPPLGSTLQADDNPVIQDIRSFYPANFRDANPVVGNPATGNPVIDNPISPVPPYLRQSNPPRYTNQPSATPPMPQPRPAAPLNNQSYRDPGGNGQFAAPDNRNPNNAGARPQAQPELRQQEYKSPGPAAPPRVPKTRIARLSTYVLSVIGMVLIVIILVSTLPISLKLIGIWSITLFVLGVVYLIYRWSNQPTASVNTPPLMSSTKPNQPPNYVQPATQDVPSDRPEIARTDDVRPAELAFEVDPLVAPNYAKFGGAGRPGLGRPITALFVWKLGVAGQRKIQFFERGALYLSSTGQIKLLELSAVYLQSNSFKPSPTCPDPVRIAFQQAYQQIGWLGAPLDQLFYLDTQTNPYGYLDTTYYVCFQNGVLKYKKGEPAATIVPIGKIYAEGQGWVK